MKAVVATFNLEKALVGAFSMITNLRMDVLNVEALLLIIIAGSMGLLGIVTSITYELDEMSYARLVGASLLSVDCSDNISPGTSLTMPMEVCPPCCRHPGRRFPRTRSGASTTTSQSL